ncbi:hypothetical protein BJ170DRAFT_592237 [Xylariales sp. AK1849]|nr:hypothetical protein BJ170DRAFT_592237 [Xylariales sp. AK1849]
MTTQAANEGTAFSWLDPHPLFAIILVGPDEIPFGIQKDFLCAKSTYYRAHFAGQNEQQLENVIKLPKTSPEVFGLAQNFLYTGRVFSNAETLPGYDVLIATWKLGDELSIEGLCDEALEAMAECRRITHHIPATPLLVQVWKDAPEGSTIRKLLLTWAAEYIRSSESRSEFSKSLPQEVLSELVVAMSHLDSAPMIQVDSITSADGLSHRKNVHYLDSEDKDSERKEKVPRHRHSDAGPGRPLQAEPKAKPGRKPGPRPSLPSMKPVKNRRISTNISGDYQPTAEQKLNFCSDLLTRMLSGPGFWTRLVGPFREAVNPVEDGVPDYPEKVSKPMDLGTIKNKMERKEYTDDLEFVADVRQIFENCFAYWTSKDPMWATCEKFQKTFEEKYTGMNKWIAKMDGHEAV